jgi:adenosylhomocysteine nucleosidase
MRIGFVTALADEARTLAVTDAAGAGAAGHGHLVEIAGIGIENAARASHRLVAQGAEGLISWGTAAALDPRLQPGALIVYEAAVAPDARHECDKTWRAALARSLSALDPTSETGFTAKRPIAAAIEKAAIRERFDCAVLDMESSAVGECAAAAGIPFVVLRAIVDPMDFDIPHAALRALEHGGKPRAWPVVRGLLRRPRELLALLKLLRCYRLSLARLRLAARALRPNFGMD